MTRLFFNWIFPLPFCPFTPLSPQQSPHCRPCPWVLSPFCSIPPPHTPPPNCQPALYLWVVSILLVSAKCNEPVRGRQILYDFTHMWSPMDELKPCCYLKMDAAVQMICFTSWTITTPIWTSPVFSPKACISLNLSLRSAVFLSPWSNPRAHSPLAYGARILEGQGCPAFMEEPSAVLFKPNQAVKCFRNVCS